MGTLSKLASTAALALATTLVLSCSSDDGGGNNSSGGDPSSPGGNSPSGGSYTEKGNDISKYATKVIGTQTWMAENLDYNVDGSKCYNDEPANCAKYGRLYDWATAMTACPSGWKLPTKEEWDALTSYIETDKGCTNCDAKHLKAITGWGGNGNGLDSYGFSALPGGYGNSDGGFYKVSENGYWWSASGNTANAYRQYMDYGYEKTGWGEYNKGNYLFSVRCIKD